MGITYTGSRGYISAQAKVGTGIIDSVFAGENAIHEPDGWRFFNGRKQIDPARTVSALAYVENTMRVAQRWLKAAKRDRLEEP
jgi:hypothetical protein